MVDKARRDVIVKCAHGERGGDADFVERFRWMAGQATWVPTTSHTRFTNLRGDVVDTWDPSLSGPIRQHFTIECRRCRNSVGTRDEALQQVCVMLTLWSDYAGAENRYREAFSILVTHQDDHSVTVSLDGLRASLKLRNDMLPA